MSNEQVIKWIELVELSCVDLKINYIDIIIDQAGSNFSLLPTLDSFESPVQWCSLFTGLPEEILHEDAPLLIRIELDNAIQRQWLVELVSTFAESHQLLLVASLWPFDILANYLTQCIDVFCGSQEGILRFYDPRLFPLLFSHILDEHQQQQLLKPAIFWSWMDRDNRPRQMPGDGTLLSDDDAPPKFFLNDQQQEYLMCLCDVNIFLDHVFLPEIQGLTQEALFVVCYEGMIAATSAGLLMDDEREEFVKEFIINHMANTA